MRPPDIPTLFIEWLEISQIKSGYIFRPFNAFDQPVLEKNVTIVGISLQKLYLSSDDIYYSSKGFFLQISVQISKKLTLTHYCLVGIHFGEEVCNIFRMKRDGLYESSAHGEVGLWNLIILLLFDILSEKTMNLYILGSNSWILNLNWGLNVRRAEGNVIALGVYK
jgi:hypothetical protein